MLRARSVKQLSREGAGGHLIGAIAELQLDPARTLVIGDKPSDLEAGKRAGVAGVLFRGGDLDDFVLSLGIIPGDLPK